MGPIVEGALDGPRYSNQMGDLLKKGQIESTVNQ